MPRNRHLFSDPRGLRSLPSPSHPYLDPHPQNVAGAFSFLNATSANYQHSNSPPTPSGQPSQNRVAYRWTARNNRKGRHALRVPPLPPPDSPLEVPEPSFKPQAILNGLVRMAVKYPFYDISYTIAYLFTWGSIVWVLNAFFVFYPFVRPDLNFPNETTTAAGVTAFVGATIFEVGSVLLIIEAVNENRTGCFGWAMEQVFEEHGGEKKQGIRYHLKPDLQNCEHHHANKSNFVGKSKPTTTQIDSAFDSPTLEAQDAAKPDDKKSDRKNWVWFASWHELTRHYLHELGFLACLFQLLGASIFWISGFTALPGILNVLSPGLTNGIYWTPQVVGGSGFIISGFLFMVETQPKWYIPAPSVLGWHIGLWNLVGGLGFTLSPCFGYDTATWAQYQAALSTFWGSWAFLIGSTIQWYESLDKHPIEVDKS